MKKLFIILIIFLTSGTCFAQFAKPAGIHDPGTYKFWKNNADSTITIYMGSVDLWNTLLSKFDSTKRTGYVQNYKLLSYLQKKDTTLNQYGYIPFYRYQFLRLKADTVLNTGTASIWKVNQKRNLNNPDSLEHLEDRSYKYLKDTIIAGLGLKQTVHTWNLDTANASVISRPRAANTYETKIATGNSSQYWDGSKSWVTFPANIFLPNDTWYRSMNYAGDTVNLFKISKDNLFEFAPKVGLGSLYSVADAGKQSIINMPLLNSAENDTLEYSIGFAGKKGFKFRALADGSGSYTDSRFILDGKLQQPTGAVNGYFLKTDANGVGTWSAPTATYQGTWNAATNSPTLADGTGTAGFWYRTVVKGVWGADSARVGSDIYYSGSVWQVIPNAAFSVNVATKTVGGIVKLDSTSIKYNASGQIYTKTDYVENVNHSGDATGATALTLATVNDSTGYYNYISANAKGLVTGTQYKPYLLAADIVGKKDISDSTDIAGYTRRDRLATSLALKQNKITTGTTSQYFIGDLSLATIPDLTVYKLKGDTTSNTGYYTINMAVNGLGFHLKNDQWLTAEDYAGNPVNLLKISKDNVFEIAPKFGVNAFMNVLNPGFNYFSDIPLSSLGNGIIHGTGVRIGGVDALKIYGTGNSTGGVDSAFVDVKNLIIRDGAALNKIAMSGNSYGKVLWSDTKYLFNLVANRILYASATNEMGQTPLGTTGQILRQGGVAPEWSTPTYPNSATTGKILIGDGTNIVLSTPTYPNASATFAKIIKSDGTNWTASTETYAAPSTTGNVMLSDGTNWTSSAPTSWNTAYTDRLKWDGGSTGLTAATGRTSLGGSTIGQAIFTLTNPSAITFIRMNADNSATALSASDYRTAIGAGTSSTVGTVTSVAISVPTGLSISGSPITTAGTLGLTLASGYVIPTTTQETNWGTAYTNRITSLTVTGSSGAATLSLNTLNIPTYTLAGLGGQAAGTYSTDIHSNITALNAVTNTNTGDNATNSQYSGLVTFPGFGITHTLASYGDHNHSGVYDVAGAAAAVTPTTLGLVIGTNVLAQRTFGTAANSAITDFAAASHNQAQTTITALPDSLLARYTKTQSNALFQAKGTYIAVGDTSTMLSRYARKHSPTFTGTVSGITSGMTGSVALADSGKTSTGNYVTAKQMTGKLDTTKATYVMRAAWTANNSKVTFPGFGVTTGKSWGYDSHPSTLANYGITETPWTGMGYVTGTPWTGEGYVTGISGSDVTTALGYTPVSGTPWTSVGYLTEEVDPTVEDATLTMAVAAGGGLSISATPTFTANAASNKTITITSSATANNDAGTIVLRDGSGYVSLTGTFCSSDSTLKKNIRPFSKVDLYNASKIDLRKFLFKSETTGKVHFGVVAQQVEKLIPELVVTNSEGKKEVNYTEMYALIIAQQAEEIKLLKELGKQLEKRISDLELDKAQRELTFRKIVQVSDPKIIIQDEN